MRYLEVRRHTLRAVPDGIHLTQAGVTLARRIGESMGPFARVVTSTLPRAFETAIAMGFAVDTQHEGLTEPEHLAEAETASVDWDNPFMMARQFLDQSDSARQYVQAQANLWRSLVSDLPDGAAALAISHGGVIEAGAIACFPAADFSAWGRAFSYCEGVRLAFDGQQWASIEILRV